MDNLQKATLQKLEAALQILPDCKRDYLMGYAEGVLAISQQSAQASA